MIERIIRFVATLVVTSETREAAIECQCQTTSKVAEQGERIDALLGVAEQVKGPNGASRFIEGSERLKGGFA